MELGSRPLHHDHIEKIISCVPPKDLSNLSRASTYMRNLSTKPKLWKNMKVSKKMIYQVGLSPLFSIDKFKTVRAIDMSRMELTHQQIVESLKTISSSSVEELDLSLTRNMRPVPPALLGEVAGKLVKLDLGCRNSEFDSHSPDQCLAVVEACASSPTLKDLSLSCSRLSAIPPQLLGEAVGRLHKVNLNFCRLTDDQCTAFFGACVSSTTLKDVSLVFASLSAVPPRLIAEAVGRLHKVDLRACGLTSDHHTAILGACASSTSLTDLSLEAATLSAVPPLKLAEVAGRLGKINLSCCKLTKDQCVSVLEVCVTSSTLDDVDLQHNDLDQIPAALLARAVGNLARVGLKATGLSTVQCLAVMETCVSSSKLISVDLGWTDMREVPLHKLREAAENLKAIHLDENKLTTQKTIAVLQACVSSPQLSKVALKWIDLRDVSDFVLTQAVFNLQRVNLCRSEMTILQKTAVLQAILASTSTVSIDICDDDEVPQIPAQLLLEARNTGRLKVCHNFL